MEANLHTAQHSSFAAPWATAFVGTTWSCTWKRKRMCAASRSRYY